MKSLQLIRFEFKGFLKRLTTIFFISFAFLNVFSQDFSVGKLPPGFKGLELTDDPKNGLPPGWEYQTNSGSFHAIQVLLAANPRINNIPIQPGDYIGAFYLDNNGVKKCNGAYFWEGTLPIQFLSFRDDNTTPQKDGFAYGELMNYKIYSQTTKKEYDVDLLGFDNSVYPGTKYWFPFEVSQINNMVCYETFDAYATATPNPACIGNNVLLEAHIFIGTTGNYTYQWTSDPPGLNSTLQSVTVTPTQNTTYYLTVSDGLLTSSHSQTVLINFNPTATAGSDKTICANQTTQVSGSVTNASGLVWSSSGDGTFNNTTINNPIYTPGSQDKINGFAALTITAQPLSPCLATPSDQLLVTIQPLPSVVLPETLGFCKNQEIWVTASAANYNTLQWTTNGDGTFGSPTSAVTRYYPGSLDLAVEQFILSVMVQATAPCSGSAGDQVSVTLTKAPTCTVPTSRTKCENLPVNTSGTASNYSSLLWTTQGDGTFDNPTIMVTNYNPGSQDKLSGGTTLILFAYGNGPCNNSPASDDMIVIIKPLPVVDAGNTNYVCSGSYLQLNASAQNYSGLLWTTLGDGTFSSITLLNPKYYPGTNDVLNKVFTLKLTANPVNPCTVLISDLLTVNIVGQPTASITTQSGQVLCRSSNLQLEAVATNYVNLQWSTSGDGTFSDAGILNPVYYPGPVSDVSGLPVTLTFKAIALTGCGTDVTKTISTTFRNYASANAGNDATICQTSAHSLSGMAGSYSSLLWTTSGNGTFSSTSTLNTVYSPGTTDISNGTVTLTLTANPQTPCTVSASDVMILTIQKSPTANAGADATICQTGTRTLTGTATSYSGVLWTTSGNGTFSSTSSLTPVYTPGTTDITNGSVNLTLSALPLSPCTVSTSDAMILTIRKNPTANAGADATICQTGTRTLTGTATNYSGVLWTTSGNGTFSSTSSLTPVYTPGTNDITNGSVNLTLSAIPLSPCTVTASDVMILTIQKSPSANAGADATICQTGTRTLAGTATNYSGVLWTTSGNGTFSSANSLTPVYTPGSTDITNGSATLTLTAIPLSPCTVSGSDAMILTIQQSPYVVAGTDMMVCENETSVLLSGTLSNASSFGWSTTGDGTFSSVVELNTYYYPGNQDKLNGFVDVCLTGNGILPCENQSDCISISFQKIPVVFAGNDVTIPGEILPHCLYSATAEFTSGVIWSTSGSGTFDNNSIVNSCYYPSQNDIDFGTVTLTMLGIPLTPCTLTDNDDIVITFEESGCLDAVANAGNDLSACITEIPVILTGIASYYTSILWSTNGDGSFSEATSLTTQYFPGQNDLVQGNITLCLKAFAEDDCNDATDCLNLTINKLPTANAGADATICQNGTRTLSGTASNYSSVLWTTSGNGTFSSTSSLNAVYTPGTTDITNGTATLTLTAIPLTPCTVSASDAMILTIQKSPTVNAGADATICQTATRTLSGAATNYSSILWTTSGNGTFSSTNSLSTVYTAGTTDINNGSVTITLSAVPLSPCTISASDAMILTIRKSPTANAGEDATICQGSTRTLSGVATNHLTVVWTTSGNGTFSPANALNTVYTPGTTDITNGFVTLTLTAVPVSPCNVSVSDAMVLTIQKTPTANAGDDATICQTGTKTLSGTATNYSSVLWTTSGNGTFGPANSLNTVYTPGTNDITNGSVTLTLTASPMTPCTVSASDGMVLTIQKSPTANAGTDATICQTATRTLSGVATNYSSILWTTSGNGTFSSASSLTAVYTPGTTDITNGSVTLTLTASPMTPCSVSASDAMILTIQKSPTANAGVDATICQTGTRTLSGTATNYSSVLWTTSGNGTFSSTSSLNTVYTPGTTDITNGSVNLTLTANAQSPCSVSLSDAMTLTIRKSPTANAGADATVCQGTTKTLSGTATNHLSVVWTTSGNGTFSPANALNTVYTPGTTDITNGFVNLTLTAVPLSPCSVSASDAMILTIQKIPTANAGVDVTICQDETVTVTGTATNQSGILWTTSGNGTFSSAGSLTTVYTPGSTDINNGSVVLTLNVFPVSPCSGTITDSKTITIISGATAFAGDDVSVCEGSVISLVNAASSNFNTLLWSTSGDGTFNNPTLLNPDYVPGPQDLSNGNVTVCLTANGSGSCGDAQDCMNIIISSNPEIITGGTELSVCQFESITFAQIQFNNYANIQWFTTNGTGYFDDESSAHPTYYPSSYDYTLGCIMIGVTASPELPCVQSAEETFSLCFQKMPSANAGVDATINEPDNFQLNAAASDYSSIQWATNGDGTFSSAATLSPIYTPGIYDKQNGNVILTVNATPINPCNTAATDDLKLTIFKQVQINLQAGWQGFSSFIDMNDQNFEQVMAPIADKVIVAQNGLKVYWPEYGINTIGNFDNLEGYKLKLSASATLPMTGFVFDQKTVNLPQGWSILPVLSGCPVNYTKLISQLGSKLVIVNEIGGTGVIWPANGVFTIPELLPGKAYMIKVTTNCSFTFPPCGE